MSLVEINNRYSQLAQTDCCLSCGGAINYSNAAEGEICVDLGSGRGTDVFRMADSVGSRGFVFGVDISDGMIEKAYQTAEKLNITNVKFIKSNLESILIDSNKANLVISNCTLNHASDKQKVWNEIFRILKDGGRFVVSDIYSSVPVPEEYRKNAEAIAECWAGAVTRDEYLKNIESAGFTSVKIIEESAPYKKGEIMVSSWTIAGFKPSKANGGKCCSN